MSKSRSGLDRNGRSSFVQSLPGGRTVLHVNYETQCFELHAAPEYTDDDITAGMELAEAHGLEFIDPERHPCYVEDLDDGGAVFQLLQVDAEAPGDNIDEVID